MLVHALTPGIAWFLIGAIGWYALGWLGNAVLFVAEPLLADITTVQRHHLACAGVINLAVATCTLLDRNARRRRRR